MAKYATCECHICHRRVPKPEATSKVIQVKSGQRVGVSTNFSRKKSTRWGGSQYYRNKTVWTCSNCAGKAAVGDFGKLLFWGIVVLFCLAALS